MNSKIDFQNNADNGNIYYFCFFCFCTTTSSSIEETTEDTTSFINRTMD